MAHNYYVTAHKPTGATLSVAGNFTSETDLNLIVAKTNRLEIQLISTEGLRSILEVGIYGRIAVLKLFHPQNERQDSLLVVTERYRVMVLKYDAERQEIVTRAYGNVQERLGRPSDTGILGMVDPESKVIGVRLYDGQLKIIPLDLDSSKDLKAYTIRLQEIDVIDLDFLHGCSSPTAALIYQDQQGRHLKIYEISLADKDIGQLVWKQSDIEAEASMLISVPRPAGGVIVVGQETIAYYNEDYQKSVAPPELVYSPLICFGRVDSDGSRFLLGDMQGRLMMLLLEREEKMDGTVTITDLKLTSLGTAVIAKNLTYLDNGFVFVGSTFGDSQLVKLNAERDESGSFIHIMESFTNIGPIVDMEVVDLERQGQGQLVTCSGAYTEGSLRVIRNGIGIHEEATLELEGIKGIWPLKVGVPDATSFDNTLVLSFVGQTTVLTLSGGELEGTEIPGFSEEQTLVAGNVLDKDLVQITALSVRLVDGETLQPISEWKTPDEKNISVAACNRTQIVLASGRRLFYLEIHREGLNLIRDTVLDYEVACIDITPPALDSNRSDLVAIGLWTDISVRVHRLPTLDLLVSENLGGDIIPRSVLLAVFEGTLYLLCALGDGSFFYFKLNPIQGVLSGRKKIILGTQPTLLKPFYSRGSFNVFTCSDRPTVIYSSNGKLVFSNVNFKGAVSQMCPLNAEAYQDSLAIANNVSLSFGTVDDIQKLHITTIPLNESPKRIAFQESTQSFAVCSTRYEYKDPSADAGERRRVGGRLSASLTAPNITNEATILRSGAAAAASNEERAEPIETDPPEEEGAAREAEPLIKGETVELDSLLIIDQHSFEVTHAHHLKEQEWSFSLMSCQLNDGNVYYVVGTAMLRPREEEPKEGRLLLFQLVDSKLVMVASKEVNGGVMALTCCNGRIVAAVNSSVNIYSLGREGNLKLECKHASNILALYLKSKGDFILVGDLMRSMCVLLHKPDTNQLEEIARDFNSRWMTAVEIIDDDTFLGGENAYNLFVCQKDSVGATDEERRQLQDSGYMHIGNFVNVFRHGSLVMKSLSELAATVQNTVLFGTVSGAVGLVATLKSEEDFDFLTRLQKRLAKVITSPGNIEHADWRSFYNEVGISPLTGFIDGDLIERFSDLEREDQMKVCQGLKLSDGRDATVEDVVKLVEDLTRIH